MKLELLTGVQDVDLVEALVLVVAAEDHHKVSHDGGAVVRPGSGVGAVDGGVAPVPTLRVEHGHVVLPLPVGPNHNTNHDVSSSSNSSSNS